MATKSTKAVTAAKKKAIGPLAWGSVMTHITTQEEANARQMAVVVAEIYGVPHMCVTILGSQPYLNKEGRLFLLNELTKKNPVAKIETEYLQISTAPNITAICKKRIVFKDGMFVEGIGEANPNNIKLNAVKATLNMMAETRALNRTIWQAIGSAIWERVAKNLKKKALTNAEMTTIVAAGQSSAEEMDRPEPNIQDLTPYQKALKILEKDNRDIDTLEEWRIKIEQSDLYTKTERKELLLMIDRQMSNRIVQYE